QLRLQRRVLARSFLFLAGLVTKYLLASAGCDDAATVDFSTTLKYVVALLLHAVAQSRHQGAYLGDVSLTQARRLAPAQSSPVVRKNNYRERFQSFWHQSADRQCGIQSPIVFASLLSTREQRKSVIGEIRVVLQSHLVTVSTKFVLQVLRSSAVYRFR